MRSSQSKNNNESNALANKTKQIPDAHLMNDYQMVSHDSTSYSSNNSNKATQNSELLNGSPEYSSKLEGPASLQKQISFSHSPQEYHGEFIQYSPKFYDPLMQTASFQTFRNVSETPKPSEFALEHKRITNKAQKPLMQLEIQISNDNVAVLNFYENEDVHQAAVQFCADHNLPEEFIPVVEKSIHKSLKRVFKKKKSPKPEASEKYSDQTKENKSKDKKHSGEQPALVLTLEIDGKAQNVKVYRDQDPLAIAENFCVEHNLDSEAKYYIAKTIEYQLSKEHPTVRQGRGGRRREEAYSNDYSDDSDPNPPNNHERDIDPNKSETKFNDRVFKQEEETINKKENALSLGTTRMETNAENDPSEFKPPENERKVTSHQEEQSNEPAPSDPQSYYERWQNLIQQKHREKQQKDNTNKREKIEKKVPSKVEIQPIDTLKEETDMKTSLNSRRYQSLTSKEMRESSMSGPRYGTQIFNRLYYQGMRAKRKQAELQKERQMKLLDDKNLTFHPKISDFARRKFSERANSAEPRQYEDAETIKKKEMLRLLEQEKVLRELCPFKPTIAELPPDVGYFTSRSKSPTIVSRLYSTIGDHYRRRREELEALFDEIHPFKPTLNEKTLELLKIKEKREAAAGKKVNQDSQDKETSSQNNQNRTKDLQKELSSTGNNIQTNKDANELPSETAQKNSENRIKLKPLKKLFRILQDEKGILAMKNLTKATGLHIKSRNIILQIFERSNQTFTYNQFLSELSKRNLTEKLIQFLNNFPEINRSSNQPTPHNATSSTNILNPQVSPKSLRSPDLNTLLKHFPKIDVFLKRFDDLGNTKSIEADLSKKSVESHTHKLNQTNNQTVKLTKHYKQKLLESHENSKVE